MVDQCQVADFLEQSLLLGTRLDAAYQYQKKTFEDARADTNYNVRKHDTDWVDSQQLSYLCDERMHLLTDDGGIRKKCASSTQSERVRDLENFL